MGPIYSYSSYAFNMGLLGVLKAGHIHQAVRAGREELQSGARGENCIASVPQKWPAKSH